MRFFFFGRYRFRSCYHFFLFIFQLICPEQPLTKPDDSQIGAQKTSPLVGFTVQTDAINMPQDENIEIKMEINVEDTMLQGYQLPNDDREKSSTTILASQLINHDKSKDVEAEYATPENTIKVKQEVTVKSEVADELGPCSICGLTFANKPKKDYHMVS